MIKHKRVEQRKKYMQGRGLVIVKGKGLIDLIPSSLKAFNAMKAASEIMKIGQGFQVL
jgi:hypothetical protein